MGETVTISLQGYIVTEKNCLNCEQALELATSTKRRTGIYVRRDCMIENYPIIVNGKISLEKEWPLIWCRLHRTNYSCLYCCGDYVEKYK